MSNFKLNLPTDIPGCASVSATTCWIATCATRRRRIRWRSSIAVFEYQPEAENQTYDGMVITYLKVSCTITGTRKIPRKSVSIAKARAATGPTPRDRELPERARPLPHIRRSSKSGSAPRTRRTPRSTTTRTSSTSSRKSASSTSSSPTPARRCRGRWKAWNWERATPRPLRTKSSISTRAGQPRPRCRWGPSASACRAATSPRTALAT